MSFLDALRHRVRSVFRADAEQRERDDEFEFHQSLDAPDSSLSARLAARREFGNATYLSEEVRWAGATRWIDAIRQDVRYGLRALRRSPVFTLVAVSSIGLGVGANTAVFGIINKVMLTALPIPKPGELVMLREHNGRSGADFNWNEYKAVASGAGVRVAAFSSTYSDSTEINGSLVSIGGVDLVSVGYHQLLGLTPAAGRFLSADDEAQAAPVAVINHDLAIRFFETPAAAIGKTLRLHGVAFTVIGVAPEGYRGLKLLYSAQVVVPRTTGTLIHPDNEPGPVLIIARVPSQASPEAAAILRAFKNCCADRQLGSDWRGPRDPSHRAVLADVSRGITADKFDVREEFSRTLYALMGGVAVLLLIACTNVGNLLLARAVVRSRELAVRLSLGASRGRIVRQLLVESSLLAGAGAIVGVVVAIVGTAVLARNLPANLKMVESLVAVTPSPAILSFTALVAFACVLLFGVLPALRATRFDLVSQLRDAPTASRISRLDRGLVAVQVGLALVLASVAGLLVATLHNLASNTSSLDPERLLVAETDVGEAALRSASLRSLYDQTAEQLRRVPGVRHVAGSDLAPLLFMGGNARVIDVPGFESVPNDAMGAGFATVTPGYFEAMSMALRGRDFTLQDTHGSEPVVIVSQSVATHFFAGRDPIGQTLRFRGPRGDAVGRPFRIIGVAEDVKFFDLRASAPRELFFPWSQAGERGLGGRLIFLIRTVAPAASLVTAVSGVITSAIPSVQLSRVRPMTENTSLILGREEALVVLSITFGALAISLAAIGLYGVLAFHVSTRRREIGVRIALGADARRLVAMVMRQSFVVVIVGALFGVPLSFAASRSLGSLLYGIQPWHPAPVLVGVLVLVAVGALASLLPSRNAARVDPVVAMRSE